MTAVTFAKTLDMPRDEWLELRRQGIGGSDVSAILGINPWKTAMDVWLEKTGELKQWVNDLQSGMYVNCVYCGHRYGPTDEVPASMADVLKQHIEQCPEHPNSPYEGREDGLDRT